MPPPMTTPHRSPTRISSVTARKDTKGGYLEVGLQPYGGGLWHTLFNRDLLITERVVVREKNDGLESFSHQLVRLEEPIMRVPTLAIHLDRLSRINKLPRMVPLKLRQVQGKKLMESQIQTKKHHPLLLQKRVIGVALKEFVLSGRLDNLCMSFCSLKALIDLTSTERRIEDESGIKMVALYDHEEVGSGSTQVVGSPVMLDALSRITSSFTSDTKI